ncbi:MAG: helix-turn-helix domain-containing protein [Bacteroidia bacterium]
MSPTTKIPRILKINQINGMTISVIFSNGESRSIRFNELLQSLSLKASNPGHALQQANKLKEVTLAEGTLRWPNILTSITGKNGQKLTFPFEIGADVLYKYSTPDTLPAAARIGRKLKVARKNAGLSQQDLAQRSGTSRSYISRLENDRSDIELGTLRKIVETGLGKKLEIDIAD